MYILNKNYVPQKGDYFSYEDWTDDQIKWLADNTPENWFHDKWIADFGFNGRPFLEVYHGGFGSTHYLEGIDNARIIPDTVLISTEIFDWVDTYKSPIPQPSPHPKKVLVSDLSEDTNGVLLGMMTHRKVYYDWCVDLTCRRVLLVCDDGVTRDIGKSWFKEAYIYDEDESELVCRDIELNEDDYLVLAKHTEEQIRLIAKYYPVFELEETLDEGFEWSHLAWNSTDEFVACDDIYLYGLSDTRKEYHFNDLFYLEGE